MPAHKKGELESSADVGKLTYLPLLDSVARTHSVEAEGATLAISIV